MWGGRFDKAPADRARAFTRSFPIDRRMYREDIVASRAHAAMLGRSGLLPKDSVRAIIGGLDGLLDELVAAGEVGASARPSGPLNLRSRFGRQRR